MPPGTSELFLLELALEVPFFPFPFGEEESLLSTTAASKLPGITVEGSTGVDSPCPMEFGIGREGEREREEKGSKGGVKAHKGRE